MADFGVAVGLLGRLVGFDTTSRNSDPDLMRDVDSWLAAHGIASRISLDTGGGKADPQAVVGPALAGGAALSADVGGVPVDRVTLRRQDGRLIGRGIGDLKGFAAIDPCRPIHRWPTHDEETNAARAEPLVTDLDAPPPAGCGILDVPTGMAPAIVHKGCARREVTVTGLAGHSSRTTETANARQSAAEGVALPARRARASAIEGHQVAGFEPPFTIRHVGTFQADGNSAGKVSHGTEAGLYQAPGIATIACGPGHIAQARQPEEWVAETELQSRPTFLGRLADTLTA